MLIIAHKDLRYAAALMALFCMTFFLCAAPVARAEPQTAQAEGVAAAKKKIALAQFDVANTQHVDDISNIYDGLPLALSSRLEASGEFLTAYTARPVPAEAGEAQRNAITQIAGEAGAQFLISGMVVNAGTRHEKGFLGTALGEKTVRHIEIELAVYDGVTGARLLLRRLNEQAQDKVKVGNDKPFGSSIFFETELGQALNRLLDVAATDIRTALEKVPFSAHIVRAEEKKVFLDAGSDSLLKPGDKLVAYVRDTTPIIGLKGSVLGVTERVADMVTLTEVQPQFSIGELTEGATKHGIRAGSIAKIDPDEQRALMAKQIAAQQMAKAEQEAKAEAERVKSEQAAQAEAARVKAAQDAKAEASRIKAEKAQAKAKAAAEAKAAKLKAAQEAKTRISAAQKARDRAARLKAQQEAREEAARVKNGKKAQAAEAQAQAAAEIVAPQVAVSGVPETQSGAQAVEPASVKKKPGVLLKLKPIMP